MVGTGRRAAIALLIVALGGCREDGALSLSRWQVVRSDGATRDLALPAHLDRFLAGRGGSYTLRSRVALSPALCGKPLALVVDFLPALVTLRVDGREITGRDSDLAGYRDEGPHRWRIPGELTSAPALLFELTVRDAWPPAEWLDTVPRLDTTSRGDWRFLLLRALGNKAASLSSALLGLLAMLYAGIFLLDRSRRAEGWLALAMLTGLFYPLFLLGQTQAIFGRAETAVVFGTMVVAVLANVFFAHAELDLGPPSTAWYGALAVVAIAGGIAWRPFVVFRTAAWIDAALVAFGAFYLLHLSVRLFRRRQAKGAEGAFLVCWIALAATAWPDWFAWLGFGQRLRGVHVASIGLLVTALVQAIALSHKLSASLRSADRLNVELASRLRLLEERNQQIHVLNEELRRQIAERSHDLSGALARLAPSSGESALHAGDRFEDRYRVVGLLGAGAMGSVYEVERLSDSLHLALKVLRGRTTAAGLARFAREAEIAARLHHPNLIAVMDVGIARSGIVYLVMELVQGSSVAQQEHRYGDVAWGVPLLAQVAAGLGAMHEGGIVHRDLKPANILLTESDGPHPVVKIADFGLSSLGASHDNGTARPLTQAQGGEVAMEETIELAEPPPIASGGAGLTQTGVVMGTPFYMAPELVHGARDARPSSDVYSFGLIAYEILTGRPPFREAEVLARMRGHSVAPPPPIFSRCPALGRRLAERLDGCLAADPAARPTALELKRTLTDVG